MARGGGGSDSFLKVGIAAHITAASPNGPRFDPNLTEAERTSIENGIWLCPNCSILIDKDPLSFPKTLLLEWKSESEKEALQKLKGKKNEGTRPRIQIDLIRNYASRRDQGFSEKNKEKFGDGPYSFNLNLIRYWRITSEFVLHIFNNSTKPAFNIKLESNINNLQIDPLQRINNLPPLEKIELGVIFQDFLEGDHNQADELLKPLIPEKILNQTIKIYFEDEYGNTYTSIFEFQKEGLMERL
ncbi:hypothetical protein [Aquiflexum sp.]|uniref:hypothetical protein n=1 Tax=Aquiflexum sp. TaxID=1872584 RepID=UPI0035943964